MSKPLAGEGNVEVHHEALAPPEEDQPRWHPDFLESNKRQLDRLLDAYKDLWEDQARAWGPGGAEDAAAKLLHKVSHELSTLYYWQDCASAVLGALRRRPEFLEDEEFLKLMDELIAGRG